MDTTTTTNTDAQAQPTYTPDYPDSGYSGWEWVETQLRYRKPEMKMSDFGRRVADILGDVFAGIYHLSHKSLERVGWDGETWIQYILYGELSTWDFSNLTRLVLLAHERHVRISVSGASPNHLRIEFHPRTRDGDTYHRHPTIDEQVRRLAVDLGAARE